MAQMQWTYVSDAGIAYRVRLYHGSQTGHVLVTVNNKVTIIDFFVRASRRYTLFLEDELMLLDIEKIGDGFGYSFRIDEEADTERNLSRRRAAWRRNSRLAVITVLAGCIIVWGILRFQRFQEDRLARKFLPWIEERGQAGMARLGKDVDGNPVWYYTAGKQLLRLPDSTWPDTLPPRVHGDEVGVFFHPGKPEIGRLAPDKPGTARSRRLFQAWLSDREHLPTGWGKACLTREILSQSGLLNDPGAPWHRLSAQDLLAWMATLPADGRERLNACKTH